MSHSAPEPSDDCAGVLIVEDDHDTRELLAELLRAHGYDVLSAQHGLAALEQLAAHSVCIILLDLMMPRMNGWEFRVEQLRRPAFAAIPVVVLSADSDLAAKVAAMNVEAALRKPVDMGRLLGLVATHCGSP